MWWIDLAGRALALETTSAPPEVLRNNHFAWSSAERNSAGQGVYEALPNCLLVRVEVKLKSHPNMKRTQRRMRFTVEKDSSQLQLVGYHAHLLDEEDGADVVYSCNHAPYQ